MARLWRPRVRNANPLRVISVCFFGALRYVASEVVADFEILLELQQQIIDRIHIELED